MKILKTLIILTTLSSLIQTGVAQERNIEVINWEDAPEISMPYAPVIRASGGTTIYLAGVTATPVYHQHPHVPSEFDHIPTDMEGQARLIMENIKKGLEAAGADFDNVVAATRYFTDLSEQDVFNRIWGEHFGEHKPTTTTVQIVQLATDPRCLVEVTVTAVID
jgi:2-iminobutanoate/2-iminopropanoate deaminase